VKYILEVKFLPTLERGKPNLQWLKFIMVTTEMVSSTDNTARGFLPVTEGSLAAGQDAISSQVLKNIVSSSKSLFKGLLHSYLQN